ncbi:hypothetical protein [Paenibacillus sp. AR247]|uniref:hypothetical protein n=1 Tax=Paenibacillus sp. AR247 TaxID=1631599 RepID=UPI000CF9B35C|nr:hypothetical protein [Paenibacillus sp. AR247]PQP85607.1 hypothetical protein CPT76_35300 [Paenibacillus sp. AR247]
MKIILQLFSLLFIVIGIMDILFPKSSWYVRNAWNFKNVERSNAALLFSRFEGFIVIIIGLFLFTLFSAYI